VNVSIGSRFELQAWGIGDKRLRSAINKRAAELAGSGTWFGEWCREQLARAVVDAAASRGQKVDECSAELIEQVARFEAPQLLAAHLDRRGRNEGGSR
jgi:hypothetical protein